MVVPLPARFEPPTGIASVGATLDALFENSHDAIVIVDESGVICYVTSGTALLLGYDTESVVGASIFDFLHPEDVASAADLFIRRLEFAGPDPGKDVRVRHSSGEWVPVLASATLLPDRSFGVCALTLRSTLDADATRELALRRRIVVSEYANQLGADLMSAASATAVFERISRSLGDVGLLTGADAVAIYIERRERGIVELLAGWTAPKIPFRFESTATHDRETMNRYFTEHLVVEQLRDPNEQRFCPLTGVQAVGIISSPFDTGGKRGVLVQLRFDRENSWWESDSDLTRSVANLCGRALRTIWSEELVALTYRHGPVGFSIRTFDGALVDCNQQYLDLYQITRKQAEIFGLFDLLTPEHRAPVAEQLQRLRLGEIDRFDSNVTILSGTGVTMRIRSSTCPVEVPGSGERLVLTSVEDITSAHAQQVELEFAANHDALTGVANRTAMCRVIDHQWKERGRMPALLIVDLDRFKLINDSHGHAVGDRVLQMVVARISEVIRVGDVLARLGGDEFAIVAPDANEESANALAARVRRALEYPIEVGGISITQSVSIGAALGEDDLSTADLLVRADRALYAAKHQGRNGHVLFDASMRDAVLDRLTLERELREAVNDHQFDIHFQPEFETDGCHVVGAEALIRWRHPERGLLAAGEFIGIAERCGLIDDIGRIALTLATHAFVIACSEANRPDLKLRVNISAREFARPELPTLVAAALGAAGLEPHRLCLEMTEMTLMDAPEVALRTLGVLHEVGVTFAIDDFGTGYSSLAYLKRFPVDAVKIDRTFVEDVETDADSLAIVESIVGLARALSIEAVAEGVETVGQLEMLRSLGCERAQGFLVAGALAPCDFTDFLTQQHAVEGLGLVPTAGE